MNNICYSSLLQKETYNQLVNQTAELFEAFFTAAEENPQSLPNLDSLMQVCIFSFLFFHSPFLFSTFFDVQ
jgi:hypothetical protein